VLFVEDMSQVDAATWDRLLQAAPGGGHALQTHAWGQVKAQFGWRPLRLALKEGQDVLGVAQVLLRRPPGCPVTVAYCPKGPWLDWSNAAHVDAMLAGMERLLRAHCCDLLRIESELPFGPGLPRRRALTGEAAVRRALGLSRKLRGQLPQLTGGNPDQDGEDKRVVEAREFLQAARDAQQADGQTPGRAVFDRRGWVKSMWDMQFRTTMVVDLDQPPEALLARMKSKWRYNINLAHRKGVSVIHDNSVTARRLLYEMHVRTAQRDGFLPRPRSYYLWAWDRMIEAGYAHIFLALHEERPLAGILVHVFGQKAWYQVGASETDGRSVMPAHAAQFHAMAWAQQQGISYYDMVAIPNLESIGEHDPMWGLYVFKSGFGSRPIEWAGAYDKVLAPAGHLWEFVEPAYYRLYRRHTRDAFY
jgi:lipid II:glycine glycyltransferase (peptidoglycan interpeptide bridge formation enzyme)